MGPLIQLCFFYSSYSCRSSSFVVRRVVCVYRGFSSGPDMRPTQISYWIFYPHLSDHCWEFHKHESQYCNLRALMLCQLLFLLTLFYQSIDIFAPIGLFCCHFYHGLDFPGWNLLGLVRSAPERQLHATVRFLLFFFSPPQP